MNEERDIGTQAIGNLNGEKIRDFLSELNRSIELGMPIVTDINRVLSAILDDLRVAADVRNLNAQTI